MLDTLQQLALPDLVLWGAVAVLALAVMVYLAILEGRHFRALGCGPAWLRLRLATLPILAVALVGVFITVSAVGIDGPQALAVGYMALLSVGTLIYFGLHAIAGRVLGLHGGQAAWIAFSGLLLLGVLPAIGGTLSPFINVIAKIWKEGNIAGVPNAASPFKADARRLVLPGGEAVLAIAYRAPEGIRLSRVDMQGSGNRARDVLRLSTSTMCREGNDLHLFWPAERPLPALAVFWQNAAGQDRQSTLTIEAPAGDATPLSASWTATTATLSAAVPREAISLVWLRPSSPPLIDGLTRTEPEVQCIDTVALPERAEHGRAQGLRIRIDHALPKGPTWVDLMRDKSATREETR